MIDELDMLARFGGIAHLSVLEADGADRQRLQRLVVGGLLVRPRRGWYALPNADALLVRATQLGGRVTCITALRKMGVWCVDDHRLHLAVSSNTGHPPLRQDGLCIHYSRREPPISGPPVVSVLDALADQFRCQTGENVIVAIDSALNKGLIRRSDLNKLRSRVPKKYWPLLDCVDGNCESGLETKVRLRLGRRGVRYRTQARIPGVGRVDILIGDRLIVETDGIEFHTGDAAIRDRDRDLLLHRLGYIVIRVTYAMVMYRWDEVESVITSYISRREHRWSARHVRAGLA
jgi:very-short-patch-repair endonuclease